ncbi:flowering time control protein fca [Phtheirospermum japonicum]|uniref:Flowering time control protein fca n=1 Tax=Phtheirospermum japonicum TaxID=374723 RepID=A0A830D571_9LAMI|nr:flowering time control protein fca [Phtheirospermum japonicum]
MEVHGGERRADQFATTSSFPTDGNHHPQDDRQDHFHGGYHHHHHQTDHRHHHNFNGEQNDSNGYHLNSNSNPSPLSGQKRQFHQSNGVDNGGIVKLYVAGITRDATEQDVAAVFGEHGDIIEIVLIKDKWTGIQQEYCFVKYATLEQAQRAIGAFNSQYMFPGAMNPMRVKYAERERERFGVPVGGSGANGHKLYVGCVNKQALRWELEEIFSPFGVLEDVFIVRDEFKQNRGIFTLDMALAAIQALNGTHVMRGCEQPLIVRFADPKKPRLGDSRPPFYNEMQQMKSSPLGYKTTMTASNAPASQSLECDWSEHVSPDGDLYYYNCTTCESRWEKPMEYEIYEQELDYLEDQLLQQQQELKSEDLSSPEVSGAQRA